MDFDLNRYYPTPDDAADLGRDLDRALLAYLERVRPREVSYPRVRRWGEPHYLPSYFAAYDWEIWCGLTLDRVRVRVRAVLRSDLTLAENMDAVFTSWRVARRDRGWDGTGIGGLEDILATFGVENRARWALDHD